MKKYKVLFAIIISAYLLCACGSNRGSYLNGHSWGETENQSNSIGWDNGKVLEYDVDKLQGASYNNGLSSFRYGMNPGDDSCEEILEKFKEEYGMPDDTEQDTAIITKYIWYEDVIRVELYLGEGSSGIIFDVRFVNDEYE